MGEVIRRQDGSEFIDWAGGMNWQKFANLIYALSFVAGLSFGIFEWLAPEAYTFQTSLAQSVIPVTAFLVIGTLAYPWVMWAIFEFHRRAGSGLTIQEPRTDRCFFNIKRPIDTLLLVGNISFWIGAGMLTMVWTMIPIVAILGVFQIAGYYSVQKAIHLIVNSHAPSPMEASR